VSHLPAGTVTFLFTDIEGSTRKWQNWPHKMKVALKRHDEILQKAIDDSGGWVFKTVGDAFCAAFHTAMDCINCVIEIQLAINSEEWDLPELIKVRMSIHTGEAIERNNDYYGPALNRVARLESLAYGGQVLMSLVTAELVRDMLPEPAGLRFMGDHRLKDLTRPEGVYQLTHPDIPVEFPPIKSLDSHPHNLSVQSGLLIGREKELGIIQGKVLASKSRVVSITGTGGMGKTRISLQTAAELIEKFKNGVFFIDLTLITGASSFYSLILSTLSIKESGGKSEFDLLIGYLKDKDILLILDNFEHVMDAAVLVSKLLAECHGVKVLVTSREAIHIRGERVYRLPPLKIPIFDRNKIPSIKKLTQYDSVRLFIERALEINENFKINNKNAPAVAEICVRLDGIPLAIELAAARISALSPQALLKRLGHRLEILTFGAADLPDRQQTLRTTIDWSFDLLDEVMQDLFISLSVFKGGFDLEAADAVCSTSTGNSVLDGIEHLLEKSLLIKTDLSGGEPWFHMLETIHEYASEQLKNSNLLTTVKEKFAEYFFVLSEEGETGIQSPDQKYWMDKLSHNHENLNAVLKYCEVNCEIEKLARMAGSLRPYWEIKGFFSGGQEWYKRSLNKEIVNIHIKNNVNIGLGSMYLALGQYQESLDIFVELYEDCKSIKRDFLLLNYFIGWTYFKLNNFSEALKYFEESIFIAHESKSKILEAKSYAGKGLLRWKESDLEGATSFLNTALTLLQGLGDPRSIAQTTNNLGIIFYQQNDFFQAEKYFREALSSSKIISDISETKNLLSNLGYLNYRMGNYPSGIKYYKELVKLSVQDKIFTGAAYSGLSLIDIELDHFDSALQNAEKAVSILDVSPLAGDYAVCLRILGDVRLARKEYSYAEDCYHRTIPILRKYQENEDLELALEGLKKLDNEK